MNTMIVFGPVPSRRLGRSLGINNIPPKRCSYSCVYCQVGRTSDMQVKRGAFYEPAEILKEVGQKFEVLKGKGEKVDYLTFVPDGEPTLEINLSKQIEMLKGLGVKVAVISNASLIDQEEVQKDLCQADLVSLKVDAVSEDIWRKVNRPHKSLKLHKVLMGISDFSNIYKGVLITETMLVDGINDKEEEIGKIASFIASVKCQKSYISIPTRPPAEKWVRPASENTINTAYQIFVERNINAEYLIGYEGNEFTFTGDVEENLLSIASVHPIREEAVREFLRRAEADWTSINKLIEADKLVEVRYKDKNFYMRKFPSSTV